MRLKNVPHHFLKDSVLNICNLWKKDSLVTCDTVQKSGGGFTLIELVMVIVILGILSAIAIPKFVNLSGEAKNSATKGGLGAIRSVMAIEYAKSATSGTAAFPSAITTALFADSLIPANKLNDATSVGAVTAAPSGTATSTNGWWYISASGRAGAYSDGTQDTSSW